MNDWAGDSGGGTPTPSPDIEFEVVDIDVDSVASFGEALIKDAQNVKTTSEGIVEKLQDPQSDLGETMQPVGADPRQEVLHFLGVQNSHWMGENKEFLKNVAIGVENLGKLSKRIAMELGDGDALNAASLNDVQGIVDDIKPAKSQEV